ncbi:hypothetical protein BMETH_36641921062, partial [methanotrophic bacterial endosymbiont of Bathymodiolus sp.]
FHAYAGRTQALQLTVGSVARYQPSFFIKV